MKTKTLLAILIAGALCQLTTGIGYAEQNLQEQNQPAASASVETWSPKLAPGEKPNLMQIEREATELMSKRRYEEALQRHLWYFNHALEFDRGQWGVRLSSALSDWVELGRRYPKAKQALIEIRDRDAQKLAGGEGYSNLFCDVCAINSGLQNEDATYTLFRAIEAKDPKLAQQCFFPPIEDLLVRKGEYALCLTYMGDPQAKFETIRSYRDFLRDFEKDHPKPKISDNFFIPDTLKLIEILVATGHKTDAEKIRDEAVAVLNVPKLQSAVSDAESRIQERNAVQTLAKQSPVVVETQPVSGARDMAQKLQEQDQPAASASIETWSPKLAPGEQPDLRRILTQANDLMYQESYEEALQRHLWYHNHALEFDPVQSGLIWHLSDWIELGRRYPKAKQALIEIRDLDTQKLARGEGYSDLFCDVSAINEYLGNEDATYSLFKTIEQRDPALAQQCYFHAENLLVRKGEYALCLSYMGDPEDRFETIRDSCETLRNVEKNGVIKTADGLFVKDTRQLIDILVAAGHKTDAEKIRNEAVAVLNVPSLQSAVSDAESRIQRRNALQTLAKQQPVAVQTQLVSGAHDVAQKLQEQSQPAASASVETWSPTFAPGEKPDMNKILQDAMKLAGQGKYEEALQRHLWYHNHALKFDRSQLGVRLSYALRDWIELGKSYPKAKEALIEIRDRDTQRLARGEGYSELFSDVNSINEYLGDEKATYSLFKTIKQRDPTLAPECYYYAEDLLSRKGEHALP